MIKRLLLGSLGLTLTLGIFPGVAAAAPAPRPDAHYVGMHYGGIGYGGTAQAPIGSYRLWDTNTAWRDVERSPGVYDWTVLDTAVATAEANGASIMHVLGGTPRFYAKTPDIPSLYGAGFNSEVTDLSAWRRYVRAVVTRYKGRIDAYEPINEMDIGTFFAGSDEHALAMSRIVYKVVQRVDPRAIVTTPSFVDRLAGSQYEFVRYLRNGGAKWAEAISYHPYGMPDYLPEDNAFLVSELRRKLAKRLDLYLPIWSTEINYGLPIGETKPDFAAWGENKQSAFVTRTYLLQFAAGARRVYWYNWSGAGFLGVRMADAESGLPAKPANALATVKWWMRGRFLGCTVGAWGGYTCTIKYRNGHGIVRWHPQDHSKFRLPKGTRAAYDMYGNRLPIKRGVPQYVGLAPVLYRTYR